MILLSPGFQSTPLMRGETLVREPCYKARQNFNPLPSCEGRPVSPLRGSPPSDFNPLPSCEGRRRIRQERGARNAYFNPLPSCEGRRSYTSMHSALADFNPLPSCEGRRCWTIRPAGWKNFNPLPSCEGRRLQHEDITPPRNFNPLPSCEGRRWALLRRLAGETISIHSPHARGDLRVKESFTLD